MIVQKLILKEALRLITKKFKLNEVLKYVKEPNELDEEVEQLNKRVDILEHIILKKDSQSTTQKKKCTTISNNIKNISK